MKEFLRRRQPTIIIVIIIILVGAFFFFGNRETGEITEEAAQQPEEEIKEVEEKEEEQAQEAEKTKFPTEYTVVKGDHLWKIATRFYEDGFKWTVIASENNLKNPDLIFPGRKLTLPKAEIGRTYTVVKGDTLWDISKKFYGTGFKWTKISDANPGKIGKLKNGNPLILPGQVLKIP